MIEANDLTKCYGATVAVDHLSFRVESGEIFALLGPNGAGKTTTIRMLSCLLSPTFGTASIGNISIHVNPTQIRQMIGVLVEQPGLYQKLSAWEYLDFFGKLYDISEKKRMERISFFLEMLEIWADRHKRLKGFSMGMRQKISIARSLLHDPAVLLLDEPTAGLDAHIAKTLMDYLKDQAKSLGKSVLISTHHLAEIETYCDRVGILHKGKRIAIGSPESLHADFQPKVRVNIEITAPVSGHLASMLQGLPHLQDLTCDHHKISYLTDQSAKTNPAVIQALCAGGVGIVSVIPEKTRLSNLYFDVLAQIQKEGHNDLD